MGLCGEQCPRLCGICDADEVEDALLLLPTEEETNRLVELIDCRHVFEVNGLMKWLETDTQSFGDADATTTQRTQIQMKVCPQCKTVIRKTVALNTITQSGLQDLERVKIKSYGDAKENRLRQGALNEKIKTFDFEKTVPCIPNRNLNTRMRKMYNQLIVETNVAEKRQGLAISIIMKKENLFGIFEQISEIYRNLDAASNTTHGFPEKNLVSKFTKRTTQIFMYLETFSNSEQQRKDISREVEFIVYVSKVLIEVSKRPFNIGGRGILTQAFNLALPVGPITETIRVRFKQLLDEACRLQSGLGISTEEKKLILNAMGLQSGHWYKCPNDHVYCITECGGAMVESNCPECGARIGGGGHRLRSDNNIATEMDGATTPAWPTNLMH